MRFLGVPNWLQRSIIGTWSSYRKLMSTNDPSTLTHRRFRLVPSFGNGVIRTFANNTSEMKRLAAHDFEDILQVCCVDCFLVMLADAFSISVLLPYLKGFSQLSTMQSCSPYCIILLNGTHSLSSGCIQNLPWIFSKRHSKRFLGNYGNFNVAPAPPSILRSYRKRKQRANTGLLSVVNPTLVLRNQANRG